MDKRMASLLILTFVFDKGQFNVVKDVYSEFGKDNQLYIEKREKRKKDDATDLFLWNGSR